ncbi:hypothetical protein PVAG01_10968 [Phlyctema vagabunda]|uniref:Uncharacterized protein n=1 Tax=Phlyctema vagabunda TaxID=108571 RepID=A0ABR4P3R5_9HELO
MDAADLHFCCKTFGHLGGPPRLEPTNTMTTTTIMPARPQIGTTLANLQQQLLAHVNDPSVGAQEPVAANQARARIFNGFYVLRLSSEREDPAWMIPSVASEDIAAEGDAGADAEADEPRFKLLSREMTIRAAFGCSYVASWALKCRRHGCVWMVQVWRLQRAGEMKRQKEQDRVATENGREQGPHMQGRGDAAHVPGYQDAEDMDMDLDTPRQLPYPVSSFESTPSAPVPAATPASDLIRPPPTGLPHHTQRPPFSESASNSPRVNHAPRQEPWLANDFNTGFPDAGLTTAQDNYRGGNESGNAVNSNDPFFGASDPLFFDSADLDLFSGAEDDDDDFEGEDTIEPRQSQLSGISSSNSINTSRGFSSPPSVDATNATSSFGTEESRGPSPPHNGTRVSTLQDSTLNQPTIFLPRPSLQRLHANNANSEYNRTCWHEDDSVAESSRYRPQPLFPDILQPVRVPVYCCEEQRFRSHILSSESSSLLNRIVNSLIRTPDCTPIYHYRSIPPHVQQIPALEILNSPGIQVVEVLPLYRTIHVVGVFRYVAAAGSWVEVTGLIGAEVDLMRMRGRAMFACARHRTLEFGILGARG